MYVKEDIAYAGIQEYSPRVQSVRALDAYELFVRFTNGEERIYDAKPLLASPVFKPLADQAVFASVYVDYGCPVWNDGEIDLAPETIYQDGTKPSEQ